MRQCQNRTIHSHFGESPLLVLQPNIAVDTRKRALRVSLEEPPCRIFRQTWFTTLRPQPLPSWRGIFCWAAADAFFFARSPPDLLSKVKASLALNGKRRTDCSPVVLRVTSTRRLLARRTVRRFRTSRCFSAGVKSESASISFLTCEKSPFSQVLDAGAGAHAEARGTCSQRAAAVMLRLLGYCAEPGFCAVPGPLSALKMVTCTRRFFCRSSLVFSSFTGLSLPSPTIWMRYTGTLCCDTR